MKENLYYLFISGLILGSGPCMSFCAPILAGYSAGHPKGFKKSLVSYLVFSGFKLISYAVLGLISVLGTNLLQKELLVKYLPLINPVLGYFIILIGITTLFARKNRLSKICAWLNQGNIRNVGILGLLAGFAPCLPLLGILNYIVLASQTGFQALFLSFSFGLGTILSPLLLVVVFSAGISQKLSQNNLLRVIIRVISAAVLLLLGTRIILQTLPR